MQSRKEDFEIKEQKRSARFRVGSDGITTEFILNYLKRVLPSILDFTGFSNAEIYLKQERSQTIERVLSYGEYPNNFWLKRSMELGKGKLGTIAQLVEPSNLDLKNNSDEMINPQLRDDGFARMFCFPIRGEMGTLGILCVLGKARQKMNDDTEDLFMETAASIGAVVFHERQSLESKRTVIMEERERIGMDLHDGIIQSLYGVGLALQNAIIRLEEDEEESERQIDLALRSINGAIRDIRAYILDLRPRQLRDQNLYVGIESLIREFRANTMLNVELQKDLPDVESIPDSNSEILFHICQEALANIAKHAKANKVNVRLWETPERFMIKVSDDGVGFDLAKINQRIGHGLSNMTTRAEAVGGGLEIISIRHQGTTVLAWVPAVKKT